MNSDKQLKTAVNCYANLSKAEAIALPKVNGDECPYLIEMERLMRETQYQFNAREIDIWRSFFYFEQENSLSDKDYAAWIDYCTEHINKHRVNDSLFQ